MAEYIDRAEYCEKHCRCSKEFCTKESCPIWKAPAADVAPVVRCKDCKHKGWVQEPCHGKSVDYCKIWDCTLRNLEATFCSYGEQKDGGASDVRIAD